MNRNDFLRMIETSGPADRQTIVEVNELISVFPYFQSAYLLLLKGLQNTSDVKFENQLRSCAMHIADREVLYYFLKKEKEKVKEPEITVAAPVLPVAETGDTQQTVIETAKNSQDLINEIEKDSEAGTAEENEKEYPVMISTESGFDGSDTTILVIDEESGSVEERIVYMDPGFSFPEATELLELETDEDRLTGQSENIQQPREPVPSKKQLQSELIDKFIFANPRIEPVREKSDKPIEDISKPFVEERGNFVTETLARIYVNQGYFSRAIDIYEKLSLKFPEKSSYFASQIEKVKELIKK
jgi:tetratricopeptide (TPR) repeat protein